MSNFTTTYRPLIKNITCEIDNLNQWLETDQLFNRNYPDIANRDQFDQLRDQLTIREYGDQSFTTEELQTACDDEFADGAIQIERIDKDNNLFSWLLDWYGRPELGADAALTNLSHYVRAATHSANALYYVHGIGYDALSEDLLGGHGQNNVEYAFYNYLNGNSDPNVDRIRQTWLTPKGA